MFCLDACKSILGGACWTNRNQIQQDLVRQVQAITVEAKNTIPRHNNPNETASRVCFVEEATRPLRSHNHATEAMPIRPRIPPPFERAGMADQQNAHGNLLPSKRSIEVCLFQLIMRPGSGLTNKTTRNEGCPLSSCQSDGVACLRRSL